MVYINSDPRSYRNLAHKNVHLVQPFSCCNRLFERKY